MSLARHPCLPTNNAPMSPGPTVPSPTIGLPSLCAEVPGDEGSSPAHRGQHGRWDDVRRSIEEFRPSVIDHRPVGHAGTGRGAGPSIDGHEWANMFDPLLAEVGHRRE